jgi:hypothetical protein
MACEWAAFDVFHDQVVRTDVVQGADVRVIQRCDGVPLTPEAVGVILMQQFHRHGSVQPRVDCLVDLACSSLAQRFDELVGAEA